MGQRTVWPKFVVLLVPSFDRLSSVIESEKPVLVQALLPQSAESVDLLALRDRLKLELGRLRDS